MREFIYGRNAVYECLRARRREPFDLQVLDSAQPSPKINEIIKLADAQRVPVKRVHRLKVDDPRGHHQGVVLQVGAYPYVDLADILEAAHQAAEAAFILILDSLHDPQNFGALLRTAEVVGVHGVVIPLARTAQVTPAVVNSSAGAVEHLRIAPSNLSQSMDMLKRSDVWMVGLDPRGPVLERGHDKYLSSALALVVGSEGEGLHDLTRRKCDALIQLPMRGRVASLNAAVSGSIALYLAHFARQAAGSLRGV